MAGVGPTPKPRNARARRNADRSAETILRPEVVEPPELPAEYRDLPLVADWWESWVSSPQADVFGRTDWQYLRDTLPLVKAYHYEEGGLKWGAEIRLRVAQFGASPADRARLRMTFAAADEADRRRTTGRETGSARELYQGLRVVTGTDT